MKTNNKDQLLYNINDDLGFFFYGDAIKDIKNYVEKEQSELDNNFVNDLKNEVLQLISSSVLEREEKEPLKTPLLEIYSKKAKEIHNSTSKALFCVLENGSSVKVFSAPIN